MAGSLGEAVLDLTADGSQLEKDVEKAKGNAQDSLNKLGGNLQKTGLALTAGVTAPLAGLAFTMVNASSDLEESQNALNVVFGESSAKLDAYGDTAAETVGLAKSEFNELSSVTGSFLQNLGFDSDEAADKTIELTERAADMASVFNTDVDQALGAVQSALKGEFNPIENFAVKMNQAAINAKVLEMGLVPVTQNTLEIEEAQIKAQRAVENLNEVMADEESTALDLEEAQLAVDKAQAKLSEAMEGSTGEITDNMKAQAALAIIMEQTERLSGDFQNTSDGLANSTRIVKAELKDQAAALGQELLPLALEAVTIIRDLVTRFKELSPEQKSNILKFAGLAAVLGPVISIVGTLITVFSGLIGFFSAAGPVIAAIGAFLTGPLGVALAVVAALVGVLALAWKTNFLGIRDTVKMWVEFVKKIFSAFKSAFEGDWKEFGAKLREAWDFLWGSIKERAVKAWDNIKKFFNRVIPKIKEWFENIDWGEVGRNIIDGIVSGLENAVGWLRDAAQRVAQAALDAAKGWLGIDSPSSVFREEVGLNMGLGAAEGFLMSVPTVTNDVQGGFENILNEFNVAGAGAGYAGPMAGTVNINNSMDLNRFASELKRRSY